jgi:hypothetical protein
MENPKEEINDILLNLDPIMDNIRHLVNTLMKFNFENGDNLQEKFLDDVEKKYDETDIFMDILKKIKDRRYINDKKTSEDIKLLNIELTNIKLIKKELIELYKLSQNKSEFLSYLKIKYNDGLSIFEQKY